MIPFGEAETVRNIAVLDNRPDNTPKTCFLLNKNVDSEAVLRPEASASAVPPLPQAVGKVRQERQYIASKSPSDGRFDRRALPNRYLGGSNHEL
jgi:hypothetical protein